uniref:3'-5' exonuclease domain-containing protein n=1 Tax=Romanomermis culicivorax TaxID=13658 RepID=A0A915JSK1_ROMCU
MEPSNILETDDNFCQPQDGQDNSSFLPSNYNVRRLVCSTDIFNYFSSLFGGPHRVIEDPIFQAPENIKAFIRAVNLSKFRGRVVIALDTESRKKPKVPGSKPSDALWLLTISTMSGKNFIVDLKFWEREYFQKIYGTIFRQDNIIVGFHIKEDIMLVLTKFGYLDQEIELARKRQDNINHILSCCIYDLEIVLGKIKDKARIRLMALLRYRFATDIPNCFQLFAQDTLELELVADLAERFRETFEDKYMNEQWKGAYEVEEISDNINPLYFMMRGE